MKIQDRAVLMSEVLVLHQQGLPQSQIAIRVGVSIKTVCNWLRKQGIYGWNYKYFTSFNDHQKDVLLGTLMGDGYLGLDDSRNQANPRLEWGHGPKQRDYLIWKAEQFGRLFNKAIPHPYVNKDGNLSFRLSSRMHPLFKPYHDLFYSRPDDEVTAHIHKKRITPEILDRVTDQALAIWWCDDGTMFRNSRRGGRCRDAAAMALGALTVSEYELVESWFRDQGYDTTRNHWLTDDTNCVTIRLSVESTELFVSRIIPHIPDCIRFKLGIFANG